MNFIDQLDPELRVMVEKLPTDRPMNLNEIPKARAGMKKMVTAMLANMPAVEGVTSQDRFAPGAKGDPDVRVRDQVANALRTVDSPEARAGLVYSYRTYGPYEPQHGHRFNPHKLLLDPYARRTEGGNRNQRVSCRRKGSEPHVRFRR